MNSRADYEIEFSSWAEQDLDELIKYISENDSITRAVEVYLKIKEKVSHLSQFPDRGRIVPELRRIRIKEYREIIHAPYRIIYMIKERTVFVMAVFDGRREIADIIYQRITGL